MLVQQPMKNPEAEAGKGVKKLDRRNHNLSVKISNFKAKLIE